MSSSEHTVVMKPPQAGHWAHARARLLAQQRLSLSRAATTGPGTLWRAALLCPCLFGCPEGPPCVWPQRVLGPASGCQPLLRSCQAHVQTYDGCCPHAHAAAAPCKPVSLWTELARRRNLVHVKFHAPAAFDHLCPACCKACTGCLTDRPMHAAKHVSTPPPGIAHHTKTYMRHKSRLGRPDPVNPHTVTHQRCEAMTPNAALAPAPCFGPPPGFA